MSGPFNDIGAYEFNSGLSVSENSHLEDQISLYPNPTNNYFIVDLKNNSFTNSALIIYDAAGKEITREKILESKTIFHHNLPSGIYFYSILAGSKKSDGKFVVH